MGMLFGGWAREEEERLASMSRKEIALEKDQDLHPEKYYEIMKAFEIQKIQNAKKYSFQDCPEVKILTIIVGENGDEMIVHDIIDNHLYVRMLTFDRSKDPHDGGPYLYQDKYKKLVSITEK